MWKLRHKFLGVIWGLLVAAIAIFGFVGTHFLSRQWEREGRVQDVALSRIFLLVASDALRSGRPQVVSDYLETLLAFPDLEEVRLLESDARTVAAQGPGAADPFKPDPASWTRALASFTPVVTSEIRDGKRYDVIYQRVWAEQPEVTTLGVCYMRFSNGRIESSVRRTIGLVAGMGLVLAVVLSIIGFFFSGHITRPLEELSVAVRDLGRGRRDRRVAVLSGDELGELAKTFNRMAGSLEDTTVSKEYFTTLVNTVPSAVIVLDDETKVKFWNHAAAKIFGWSAVDVIGHPCPTIPGDQKEKFKGIFLGLLAGRPPDDLELAQCRKDGTRVLVNFSAAPLYGDRGIVNGAVILATDLSERKRLEAQFSQSEKMSAVGQLAAGVAHEINNPLGIILGFAQSAAKKIKDSDELFLPIKSIEREALRCRNLVQGLLTFSRQGEAQIEEFDLNGIIADILSVVEAQAKVKMVEVSKELGALPLLRGDKNKIQQVIINLCNNAIDAMPKGGKILVRTKSGGTENGERVILEIEDNGSGIPEEIRGKIFNPFFTTKEVGKGTGLGLSLVYEIIRNHQGTIEVKSEVGQGTTFSVSLPLDIQIMDKSKIGGGYKRNNSIRQ